MALRECSKDCHFQLFFWKALTRFSTNFSRDPAGWPHQVYFCWFYLKNFNSTQLFLEGLFLIPISMTEITGVPVKSSANKDKT